MYLIVNIVIVSELDLKFLTLLRWHYFIWFIIDYHKDHISKLTNTYVEY